MKMDFTRMMMFPFISNTIANSYPIDTEPSVDITAYLGTWYQVATSRSTGLLGTGVNFTNVSAVYGTSYNSELDQDVLTVYNTGTDENGKFTEITGYSYTTDGIDTKRKLHFDSVPVDGNYWILKLGPIKNSTYEYSIVGGPITNYIGTRFSLYVLARNREEYQQLYESEVKQWCIDNGFKFYWNEYVPTP